MIPRATHLLVETKDLDASRVAQILIYMAVLVWSVTLTFHPPYVHLPCRE